MSLGFMSASWRMGTWVNPFLSWPRDPRAPILPRVSWKVPRDKRLFFCVAVFCFPLGAEYFGDLGSGDGDLDLEQTKISYLES